MKELRYAKAPRRGGVVRTIGVFSLGAATGSVVALLFAPAAGKVTRKRIALKIKAARKTTVRRIGQASRVLARKAARLRVAATERIQNARQWVGHTMNGNGNGKRRIAHHA